MKARIFFSNELLSKRTEYSLFSLKRRTFIWIYIQVWTITDRSVDFQLKVQEALKKKERFNKEHEEVSFYPLEGSPIMFDNFQGCYSIHQYMFYQMKLKNVFSTLVRTNSYRINIQFFIFHRGYTIFGIRSHDNFNSLKRISYR